MGKITVRKREKNELMYASTRICAFQHLTSIQTYAAYANYRTLLTDSTIPWSN